MPASHQYRGRRAAVVENDALRVTVLEEGGHIAEIFDKRSGVNPLWTPPWQSIEPSTYSPSRHAEYGDGADAILAEEPSAKCDTTYYEFLTRLNPLMERVVV